MLFRILGNAGRGLALVSLLLSAGACGRIPVRIRPDASLPLATLNREFKAPFPIATGEKLVYEIRFARFPINASVGFVTFEFLGPLAPDQAPQRIGGLPIPFAPAPDETYYHLRAEAVSKGILLTILGVDVKDRFETLIDTRDLAARLSFKELKEGKKHVAQASLFDRSRNTVQSTFKDLNRPEAAARESARDRKDGMLDLLSAFFFVRLQKLKEGQLLQFPVSDDAGSYVFDIVVGKTEKLSTDCGKVKTIVLEPRLFGPGRIFTREGEMTMWMSADMPHVPLRLIAKTASGTVTARLTNFRTNCKIIEPDPQPPGAKTPAK